jgi:hypothetical protein
MALKRRVHRVTVIGPIGDAYKRIIGTNIVPIDPPGAIGVNLPDGNQLRVYSIDFQELSEPQRTNLANYIAQSDGLSEAEVRRLLRGEEGYAIPADYCLMERYTYEQVGTMRDLYREQSAERNPQLEALRVARDITSAMLGRHWVEQNITTQLNHPDPRMDFLNLRQGKEFDGYRRADRIIELADYLFTLQWCRGFDPKLGELRALSPSKPEVPLEDLYIELQIATMFVRNRNDVQFVGPTGLKEHDFDLLVTAPSGTVYPTEVKCKRDETPGDALALRRTLRNAAKQLPKDPPGLVIARVPEVWFQDQDLRKKIFQVTSKYVNGPTRLIGVVLVWEEWGKTPHGIAARLLKYELFVKVSIAEKIPQAVPELWRPPSLSLSYGTFL